MPGVWALGIVSLHKQSTGDGSGMQPIYLSLLQGY